MSYSITPPAAPMPSIRAGEIDSRYIDCTQDLGSEGDYFTSVSTLSMQIIRVDGNPTTSGDLQLASGYTPTLDSTGLIPTFWYYAPNGAVETSYYLTLIANKTAMNRYYERDCIIYVAPKIG